MQDFNQQMPRFRFAICTLSTHDVVNRHQGWSAATHGTQHAEAEAMQRLWDYRSGRPIGSPRAPAGAAGTPTLGRPQHRMHSPWLLLLSVRLPAEVALFP